MLDRYQAFFTPSEKHWRSGNTSKRIKLSTWHTQQVSFYMGGQPGQRNPVQSAPGMLGQRIQNTEAERGG